jgi:superfamily II RNA helicase
MKITRLQHCAHDLTYSLGLCLSLCSCVIEGRFNSFTFGQPVETFSSFGFPRDNQPICGKPLQGSPHVRQSGEMSTLSQSIVNFGLSLLTEREAQQHITGFHIA